MRACKYALSGPTVQHNFPHEPGVIHRILLRAATGAGERRVETCFISLFLEAGEQTPCERQDAKVISEVIRSSLFFKPALPVYPGAEIRRFASGNRR